MLIAKNLRSTSLLAAFLIQTLASCASPPVQQAASPAAAPSPAPQSVVVTELKRANHPALDTCDLSREGRWQPPISDDTLSMMESWLKTEKATNPLAEEEGALPLLSEAIDAGLSGLALEESSATDRALKQARQWASLRKKGKASQFQIKPLHTSEWNCSMDPYCQLSTEITRRGRRGGNGKPRLSSAQRRKIDQLVRSLEKTDPQNVLWSDYEDSEISKALKRISPNRPLRSLVEKIIDSPECENPHLLTGLGMKEEERFPNPDSKKLAKKLYEKSLRCGDGAASIKAGYRLGLLRIWDEEWEQAEAALTKVTENQESSDFRARALYWRRYCAQKTGNTELQKSLKDALAKEAPLGLHGLILLGASPTDNHPRILLRSKLKPAINAWLSAAEALQTLNTETARDDSARLLTAALQMIRETEPEVQLYAGLLLMRAGDSLTKFKLLTGLFRECPQLISRESLQMLFPLHRFEAIRSHENKMDPYLVTSLMRQESAFNERARSRVGAVGLMQLMPSTARRLERVSHNSLYNPVTNIRIGIRFFSRLTDRYQGDVELALAAYNAGPEKVDDWKIRYPVENRLLFLDLIPYLETREYVAAIARNYYWYKKLYSTENLKGAPDQTPQRPSLFKLFDT